MKSEYISSRQLKLYDGKLTDQLTEVLAQEREYLNRDKTKDTSDPFLIDNTKFDRTTTTAKLWDHIVEGEDDEISLEALVNKYLNLISERYEQVAKRKKREE